jgi:hypothetical protein
MLKKEIEVKILTFLALLSLLLGINYTKVKHDNDVLQQELQQSQENLNKAKSDVEYYSNQYNKYRELSIELENQIGVYSYEP